MAAKHAFRDSLRKIEQVRHISSPILKVVFIQRVLDEIMGNDPEAEETMEADILLNLLFYILLYLKTAENPCLGARFIETVYYVEKFTHEDQLGLLTPF